MSLRVRAVCGSTDLENDAWFHADNALFHAILPRVQDEEWLVAVDPNSEVVKEAVHLHGHASAPRILIRNQSGPWMRQVTAGDLRKVFIDSIGDVVEKCSTDDLLVVIITGHGDDDSRRHGHVRVGQSTIMHTRRFLSPKDVFDVTAKNMGYTTVVVNSCFSGIWVEYANRFVDKTTTLVISRALGTDEIHSFSESGSGRFRGGFFGNCFVNRLYREYDLHFPRPAVTEYNDEGRLREVKAALPGNLAAAVDIERKKFTTVQASLPDIVQDLQELAGAFQHHPQFCTARPGFDFIATLTNSDRIPLRLENVVDASPGQEGAAPQAGSLPSRGLLVGTAEVVARYRVTVNAPPCAASNVRVTRAIKQFESGKMNVGKRIRLRMMLDKRMAVHNKGKEVVENMGGKWPAEFPVLDGTAADIFCNSRFLDRFTVQEGSSSFGATRVYMAHALAEAGYTCLHGVLVSS
ncbi:hypothetical protein BDD12DRAFT_870727 [Trichophaea hybrida]|nr:hypothetical protein BDD12DRAFT_870727 [Trichophaea hybrida]